MKEYQCEFMTLLVLENSCFFCKLCCGIFFDYTHGPYMIFCEHDKDINLGVKGQCEEFEMEDE